MLSQRKVRSIRRRGTAAIEFGLWLPVLVMFLSAAVDWGHYMNQRVAVSRAVMDGARSGAAVFEPSTVPSEGDYIRTATLNRTTLMMGSLGIPCPAANCIVTATYCNTGAGGVCNGPMFDAVVAEVTYQYQPYFGMVPTPTNIYERFIMSTEQQR